MRTIQVSLDRIDDNPWQTRLHYDSEHIRGIAFSMLRHGLQQLPKGRLVTGPEDVMDVDELTLTTQSEIDRLFSEDQQARVQLAYGHNRRRAASLLETWIDDGRRPSRPDEESPRSIDRDDLPEGLAVGFLPMYLEQLSDEAMADLAWSENHDREALSPIEEAKAIGQRMEDFGFNQTEVAEKLGMARSTVSNKLRLLCLGDETLEKVEEGHVSERVASALVPFEELSGEQKEAVKGHFLRRILEDLEENPEEVDSSAVRRAVRMTLDKPAIDGEDFPADVNFVAREELDVLDDEVKSPTCTECPLAFTHNGALRCPNRTCLHAKRRAWREHAAKKGAGELGVEVASGLEYGNHLPFDDDSRMASHDQDEEAVAHALETGCENLKLCSDGNHNRWMSPEDIPARWVCHHGENGHCHCLEQFKEEAQEEENLEEENLEKERIDRLQEHVTSQLRPLLDDASTTVLALMSSRGELKSARMEDANELDREALIDGALENVTSLIRWEMDWEEQHEYSAWMEQFEMFFDLIGIEVGIRDPEAPTATVEQLQSQFEAAKEFDGAAARSNELKSIRSMIGRRQAYLQTYEPEAPELDQLNELHSDVEGALGNVPSYSSENDRHAGHS